MTALFSPTRRAGNLVYLSGQVGFDEQGKLVPGGLAAQTRQTLANIARTLAEQNLTLADVVSMTCYVTDIGNRPAMDQEYVRAFEGFVLPTRTTVQVVLPEELEVEMTAVALDPAAGSAHT